MWMMRQFPSVRVVVKNFGSPDDQIVQIVCGFEIGSACLLQNTTMYKTLGPSVTSMTDANIVRRRYRGYSVKREELRRPRHGGISASRTARNCNFSILHLTVPCIPTGAGSSSISIVVPIIIYEVLVCP